MNFRNLFPSVASPNLLVLASRAEPMMSARAGNRFMTGYFDNQVAISRRAGNGCFCGCWGRMAEIRDVD